MPLLKPYPRSYLKWGKLSSYFPDPKSEFSCDLGSQPLSSGRTECLFPEMLLWGGRYHQTIPVREQPGSCWGSFHHMSSRARSLFSLVKTQEHYMEPTGPMVVTGSNNGMIGVVCLRMTMSPSLTKSVSSLWWVCSQFAPKQKGNGVNKTAQRYHNHKWNPLLVCPQGKPLILWGYHPCFLMCVVCGSVHPKVPWWRTARLCISITAIAKDEWTTL